MTSFRRTRETTRTRTVPYTANGRTEMVDEEYTVHVPIPPRDWDQIIRRGVITSSALSVIGSIAWSTASIGDLLSSVVEPAIAYGSSSVFDLGWITCMGAEWLARYQPAKARLPRIAGHAALAIAMAALCVHGVLAGGPKGICVGLVGAAVSAIAKGMWTIALRQSANPLNNLAQQWVDQQMSAAGARLALAAVERELMRADGQLADYQAAYGPDTAPGQGPDKPSGQPDTVSPTVRSAVRAALAIAPDARPEDIVEQLARIGIDTDADTVRLVSGQASDTSYSRSGQVLPLKQPGVSGSIADTVRQTIARRGQADLDTVLEDVRRVHGPDVDRDTVRRTLNRVAS
ncbi:protein transporter Sec31 [Kitasatospora sp. NPDC001175]|uniref:protein transporter Sec31 n=1 Tax=Kitasatospora sp. NPDC001175 TaxID=3157103 RepID=UPI003CFDED79